MSLPALPARRSRLTVQRITSATVALLAAACGAGGGKIVEAPPDLAVQPPDLAVFDMKAPDYPAGPFGGDEGKIMPNFTFQGYFNPEATGGLAKTRPYGEVTFDDLRKTGKKYALVQLSAFW